MLLEVRRPDGTPSDLALKKSPHPSQRGCVRSAQSCSQRTPLECACFSRILGGARETKAAAGLLLWLARALSFGVVIGSNVRFGGSIYPILAISLTVAVSRVTVVRLRQACMGAKAAVGALFVCYGVNTVTHRHDLDAAEYAMTQELSAIGRYGHGNVYILNGAESYSGPDYLAEAAGAHAKVTLLSEFEGCTHSSAGRTDFHAGGHGLEVSSVLPSCSSLEFEDVRVSRLLPAFSGWSARGEMDYSFPGSRAPTAGLRDSTSLDPGDGIEISLPAPSVLLWYDWSIGGFRYFGSGCAR